MPGSHKLTRGNFSDTDRDAPFAYRKPDIHPSAGKAPFWSTHPGILTQRSRLSYFFPSAKLTVAENLNAIVRLLLYLAVILVLYTRNAQYILLPLGGMLVTYVLYSLYPKKPELFRTPSCAPCSSGEMLQQKRDNKRRYDEQLEKTCILPTVDNPFMNFNYITDSYHRDPACKAWLYDDLESQQVRKEVTDSFNYDLYRDVSDLYSKGNSQRQFFTMPWTSWPNDQTSFAKWLFRTGPTCKELGAKCAPYWNPSASYSVLEN